MTDFLDKDLDIQGMNFAQAWVEIQDSLLDDFDYLEIRVGFPLPGFHLDYCMVFCISHNHQLNRQLPGVVEAPSKT